MRHKPADRTARLAALALELAGVAAVLYAIATHSLPLAVGVFGVLAIVAAQLLGELL